MALARTVHTRVVLSDTKFRSLTMSPEGDIHKFATMLAREARMIAYIQAPSRTGELRRKIQARVPKGGVTYVSAIVECTAPHAKWVHDGTEGKSVGLGGRPMVLYAQARYGSRSPESWVGRPPTMGTAGNFREYVGARVHYRAGQDANPFLKRGLDIAKRRHGL